MALYHGNKACAMANDRHLQKLDTYVGHHDFQCRAAVVTFSCMAERLNCEAQCPTSAGPGG